MVKLKLDLIVRVGKKQLYKDKQENKRQKVKVFKLKGKI